MMFRRQHGAAAIHRNAAATPVAVTAIIAFAALVIPAAAITVEGGCETPSVVLT